MTAKLSIRQFSANVLNNVFGVAGSQRLSILIYHRVLKNEDYMRPGDPTAEQFNWQMSLISKYCQPLSLSDALQLMDAGKLPDRAVCVTFDDGYADNAKVALPILKQWNIPATIFVSTGFLNGGRMWNDTVLEAVRLCSLPVMDLSHIRLGAFPLGERAVRRKSAHDILSKIKHLSPDERNDAVHFIAEQGGQFSDNLMLSVDQLVQLHREGVEIGAHTHTHPILANLTPEDAHEEIATSKWLLEEILADNVRFFAYPNGRFGSDYQKLHRDLVRDMGFEAALTTHWGVSDRNTDRWQIPRFTPWDDTSLAFLLRLLWNMRNVI